jgi:hypothetical protein
VDNVVSRFLGEIARHIIECHLIIGTSVFFTIQLNDVVGGVPGTFCRHVMGCSLKTKMCVG